MQIILGIETSLEETEGQCDRRDDEIISQW